MNDLIAETIDFALKNVAHSPNSVELILQQMLKVDPDNFAGKQLLGCCKHCLGKNQEAVDILMPLAYSEEATGYTWNYLGLAYAGLGNKKKAEECLLRAIDRMPEEEGFRHNMRKIQQ